MPPLHRRDPDIHGGRLGVPFTVIKKDIWDRDFSSTIGHHLRFTDVHPVTFAGEKIPMVGLRQLHFEFKGRETTGKLYVAEKGPSVLEWIDQGALGIRLNPGGETQVLMTSKNPSPNVDKLR